MNYLFTFAPICTQANNNIQSIGIHLIAFIHQNEEEVKSGHDGGGHVDVLLQRLGTIVPAINGIGCRQDRRTGVQSSLNVTHTHTKCHVFIKTDESGLKKTTLKKSLTLDVDKWRTTLAIRVAL